MTGALTRPVTRREMVQLVEQYIDGLDLALASPLSEICFPTTTRNRQILIAISLKLRMEEPHVHQS